MSTWDVIWRVVVPIVLVAAMAGTVWFVFTEPPDQFSRPRGWQWAWVAIWLVTAGDAAFGDSRWWFERTWKACVAVLVAVAVVVAVWRHLRWRATRARSSVSPPPDPARPDS